MELTVVGCSGSTSGPDSPASTNGTKRGQATVRSSTCGAAAKASA